LFSHSNEKQDKAFLLYCSIGKSADVTQIYALTGRSRQFWVVRKLESVEEPLSGMSALAYADTGVLNDDAWRFYSPYP